LTASQPAVPTPTLASFFRDPPTSATSLVPASPGQVPVSPTTPAALTPGPTAPAPTRIIDQITTLSVYDDALNSDWNAEHSDKTEYNLASKEYVHNGKAAIAVTPTNDFGRLFLTVRKDARKTYPRERVLGFSFWLNGGPNTIATSDLAVTVIGSNQYSYWVADDTSVKVDTPITVDTPLFSETRLYFLHINRSIPPNTWVEIVVWLDDLQFDPDYTYVTGLYIKNDKGFLDTYYVDDIQILVQKGE
jgi:hypothetical protein